MSKDLLGSIGNRVRRPSAGRTHDSGLAIQPMRRRHVRAILDIEEQVYPKPWTSGVFASELDQVRSGSRFYIVGLRRSQLVGYGGLMFAGDDAHITNLAVDPRCRRQGIARHLLGELAQTAIDRGSHALTLEVRVSNTAALGLYREFGFAPAGIRQRYYENSEDALVMWAHDVQSSQYAVRLARARGGGE